MGIFDRVQGFWDQVLSSTQLAYYTPNVELLGAVQSSDTWDELTNRVGNATELVERMSPADLYRNQPNLRNVVSFMGRNVAQLGLHAFEPVDENDRRRARDSVTERLLKRPNPRTTGYQLIYATMVDKKLYDRAYWLLIDSPTTGNKEIWRLPPSWVEPQADSPFTIGKYVVRTKNGKVEITPDQIIEFSGFDPVDPLKGSAAIVSLRAALSEQIASAIYRQQVWKRGGRVSSVIQRPKDAPRWSDEAAKRFKKDWDENWSGRGSKAGGTPLLEDGMTLQRIDFNATEQQWVEGTKLGLAIVAATYHVNPTMVGLLDNANYSNVREFRKMLYGDTLGPDLVDLQSTINAELLPRLGEDHLYVEFNVNAKLQGNFEEQAKYLQSSIGAPYMTRNEGRARLNLPAVEGGDELITPLNVLVGGQASPSDSDPNDPSNDNPPAPVSDSPAGSSASDVPKSLTPGWVKTRAPESYEELYRGVLANTFARQRAAVLSRKAAKADGWWDSERWNRELAADLVRLHIQTTSDAARVAVFQAGQMFNYDPQRTVAYLTKRAKSDAASINATTEAQLIEAFDSGEADAPSRVFEVAEDSRAKMAAATFVTAMSGWGVMEGARQTGATTKTWHVHSKNPRSSHAHLNGQTVPVGEKFSNGLMAPGDPEMGADEVANCKCDMTINYK